MRHIFVFTAVATMIFGFVSAQETGKTLPYRQKPTVQQETQSSQHVSDCPACRAKAKKNYYRRFQQQQNPR